MDFELKKNKYIRINEIFESSNQIENIEKIFTYKCIYIRCMSE